MSFKLYEINAAIETVLQLAIEGEMSDEDLATNLADIELAFDDKADDVACYIKNMRAEAEAIKAEIDRLTKRRQSAERAATRMAGYLSTQMLHAGRPKITTARNAISHRPSEQTVIDDISILPEACIRLVPEADKAAVKAAIKGGFTVPGAHIEKKQNIQIN